MEQNVFDELFKININGHTEEKAGLTYLSWAWAYAETKKKYPDMQYSIERFGDDNKPYLYDDKTGYMVFTRVSIDGLEHEMWLPVMDGANKAMLDHPYTYKVAKYEWKDRKKIRVGEEEKTVEAATMFDINKTLMRCLVKNLAMFGLGLYIYSGEDLPEIDKYATQEQIEKIKKLVDKESWEDVLVYCKVNSWEEITKKQAKQIIDSKSKKKVNNEDTN